VRFRRFRRLRLLRGESGILTARVEDLAKTAPSPAPAQISESEGGGLKRCGRSSSEAGESLLRPCMASKSKPKEALVHQAGALRKLEANEHDLLENFDPRARDDARAGAAHDHESATGQLNCAETKAPRSFRPRSPDFREQRDALSKEAAMLRDSLAGVRAAAFDAYHKS